MNIKTHGLIDKDICGRPLLVEEGFSRIELATTDKMAVDESGLVHGGFVFGLADYAAMIAVNHPHVVLGSADVRFLKPVRANEAIVAQAEVVDRQGRKQIVRASVMRGEEKLFEGEFVCFVLDQHVLEGT